MGWGRGRGENNRRKWPAANAAAAVHFHRCGAHVKSLRDVDRQLPGRLQHHALLDPLIVAWGCTEREHVVVRGWV